MIPMEISDNLTLRKSVDVIERDGEDELLLFNSSAGRLFEVNKTGRLIWKLLDGKYTVGEIKQRLKEEYGDSERIDRDICNFLNKLIKLNLVEVLE